MKFENKGLGFLQNTLKHYAKDLNKKTPKSTIKAFGADLFMAFLDSNKFAIEVSQENIGILIRTFGTETTNAIAKALIWDFERRHKVDLSKSDFMLFEFLNEQYFVEKSPAKLINAFYEVALDFIKSNRLSCTDESVVMTGIGQTKPFVA